MAQQIARNHAALPHAQAVARVAGHLKSFWTVAMITQLQQYADSEPTRLDPLLLEALRTLTV